MSVLQHSLLVQSLCGDHFAIRRRSLTSVVNNAPPPFVKFGQNVQCSVDCERDVGKNVPCSVDCKRDVGKNVLRSVDCESGVGKNVPSRMDCERGGLGLSFGTLWRATMWFSHARLDIDKRRRKHAGDIQPRQGIMYGRCTGPPLGFEATTTPPHNTFWRKALLNYHQFPESLPDMADCPSNDRFFKTRENFCDSFEILTHPKEKYPLPPTCAREMGCSESPGTSSTCPYEEITIV